MAMQDPNEEFPGNDRRYPSNDDPCKITLDSIRSRIIKFSEEIKPGGVILDFGAGTRPYYPFFKDKVSKYVGIDIESSPEGNNKSNIVIKEGDKLPFENDSFDTVISTQVFEHIKEIDLYINELHRILKKDGLMLISSPFCWEYHAFPQDYWRISKDGFRHLFRNFADISFSQDTNTIQTILQMFNLYLYRKSRYFKILCKVINLIGSRIDSQKGDQNTPSTIFALIIK